MSFPRLAAVVSLTLSAIALHAQAVFPFQDSDTFHGVVMKTANGTKVVSLTRTDGMDGLYIPPVSNAPFSATVLLSITRTGRSPETSYSSVARDNAGRTYVETRTMASSDDLGSCYNVEDFCNGRSAAEYSPKEYSDLLERIYIDPVQQTSYDCTVRDHLCHALLYYSSAMAQRPSYVPAGVATTTRLLGQKKIDGLETVGTQEVLSPRETHEIWFSNDLQIALIAKRMVGKKTQSLQVKDLKRSEPNSKLFTLPSGYKLTSSPPPAAPIDPNRQAILDAIQSRVKKSH